MRLEVDDCWNHLRQVENGVLATVHPERGVDAVPVVFALTDDRRLVVPIDTVKAKSTTRLQRLANLERDPRCVLLADHYDRDWSQLWWVRVHAAAEIVDEPPLALVRFDAYREAGSVVQAIVLTPSAITGWRA